jgi:hypothetical protein
MVYRSAEEMASFLVGTSGKYRAKNAVESLPYIGDVRLGLNVASCDLRPLIVLSSPKKKTLSKMEKRILPLAWGKEFVGRFMYAKSSRSEELDGIEGARGSSGFLIVQPGKFGLKGEALIHVPEEASEKELKAAMEKALGMHEAEEKETRRHVQQGRREGVHWESEIPVTDSGGKRRKGP